MSDEDKKTEQNEQPPTPPETQITDEPNSPNVAQDGEDYVHLPAIIATEYGMARSEVRMMLTLGQIFVVEGDEEKELVGTEKFDVPESKILGKTLRLKSDVRGVQFVYNGPHLDKYTGDRFA